MKRSFGCGCLFCGIILLASVQAFAGWETGAKVGFDTNVGRAVDSGTSDTYLTAYLSLLKNPSGEARIDWTLVAILEGTLFARINDLNNAALAVAPGLTFIPHRDFTVNISPFIQAKAVKDSDQSALAFGGKLSFRQQIRKDIYAGQYYIYKDSRADVDTYSYVENAFGAFLGVNWTRAFFSEISYEFSHGDSYRTISTNSTLASGMGRNRRYSPAFGTDVIRDKVDQHSFGISAGIDWSKTIFTHASYTFAIIKGDIGSSDSHAGFIGIGYRF